MGNIASDRKNARCYSLKFSRNTDSDIIGKLDNVDSIQGYIKSLIRADMKKEEEKTMKLFEGYKDGAKVIITLEDGTVMIEYPYTGEREAWNDEYYTEDDIELIKMSLLNEGFRL